MDVANFLLTIFRRALDGFWLWTTILFFDMVNLLLDDRLRHVFGSRNVFSMQFPLQIFFTSIAEIHLRIVRNCCSNIYFSYCFGGWRSIVRCLCCFYVSSVPWNFCYFLVRGFENAIFPAFSGCFLFIDCPWTD